MAQDTTPHEATREDGALAQLERQVERASLFTHTVVSRTDERVHAMEAVLYGVVDVLIETGLVAQADVLRSAARVRQEMDDKGETVGPGIALRIDGEGDDAPAFVPVNCAERLHICKAACCRLHFALSAGEVESGAIRWDLGAPYHIRQTATGCCHHLDPAGGGCSIYENRPGVCRRYSCAKDDRIWTDFDNMILNEAWISEHLVASRPRLVDAQMVPLRRASPGAEVEAPQKRTSGSQTSGATK